MRKPSKGSVTILLAAPIAACLLLWHVVFPLVESGNLLDLSWGTGSGLHAQQESYGGHRAESGAGFEETGNETGSHYSFSGHENLADRPVAPATPAQEEASTPGYSGAENENGGVVAVNQSTALNTERPVSTLENGSLSGEVSSVINAAQQVRGLVTKIKEKEADKDQGKSSSGGEGIFLLPPDGEDPMDVPIDGGLSILVAGVVGYGIRKGYNNRKKKQVTGGDAV